MQVNFPLYCVTFENGMFEYFDCDDADIQKVIDAARAYQNDEVGEWAKGLEIIEVKRIA